jgi:CheY-like chemotaxis protein
MMSSQKRFLILSAEDDRDDQILIRLALSKISPSFDISFVEDGNALFDHLSKECQVNEEERGLPGLVLLDLHMPGMNGWEALKKLKGDGRFKEIPVVVFSTSNTEEDRRRCRDLGADQFVTKQSSMNGMVNTLRKAISKCCWKPVPGGRPEPAHPLSMNTAIEKGR